MTVLVLGASGATGKHLVEQLLLNGEDVRAVVRKTSVTPDHWDTEDKLTLIREEVSTMTTEDMQKHVKDCTAIVSCLGHNMNFKGIYLKPRKLITDSMKLLCSAIEKDPTNQLKLVLMNTAGNSNRGMQETIAFKERIAIGLIRALLPPHVDNEKAAEFLRQNSYKNWVVVRPDTLTNEEAVEEYELHESPTRSAIFNAGKTSRINIGNFMMRLVKEDDLWDTWKGKMPVIYNVEKK